jgi:hypothetical protein
MLVSFRYVNLRGKTEIQTWRMCCGTEDEVRAVLGTSRNCLGTYLKIKWRECELCTRFFVCNTREGGGGGEEVQNCRMGWETTSDSFC